MGSLPWQNVRCKEKSKKYTKILEAKLETNMELLLGDHPRKSFFHYFNIDEFVDFMEYVKNLQFEEKPDYRLLITMFKELYYKSGYSEDFIFDWNT